MTVLALHAAATFFMVGLIWVIQVVHYPSFPLVGADGFSHFEAAHTRRMAMLLALPAPVEIVTAAALLWVRPAGVPATLIVASGALLVVVWITTGAVQARMHSQLSRGHDPELIRRLIATNWWRTLLWSGRGVTVGMMLLAALGAETAP